MYGFKQWEAGNGFTAAQGSLNVLETIGYLAYLAIVYQYGQQENVEGRGAPSKSTIGRLGAARTVYGRYAGYAVLIAFSSALMTLSKTVLYCKSRRCTEHGARLLTIIIRVERGLQRL